MTKKILALLPLAVLFMLSSCSLENMETKAPTPEENTLNFNISSTRSIYHFEGIMGYVYKTRKSGTTPLYWYSRSKNGVDNFFTTNWNELKGGKNGYRYEGVSCYVYSNPAPGRTPVYRYWNDKICDHFYTVNWNELRNGKNGYVYEGVQCYILKSKSAGSKAFRRYYSPAAADHVYFAY